MPFDRDAYPYEEQLAAEHDYYDELQRQAEEALVKLARENAEAITWLWRFTDGTGGNVLAVIGNVLNLRLPRDPRPPKTGYQKERMTPALRKQVFERDAYRCVNCGSHKDLACDHKKPESKGGPTTLENLQTMCRSCNSRKGNRE